MSAKYYPVLPLRDVAVYPHVIIPLYVGRPKSIAALDAAMAGSQELLLVPQQDEHITDPELTDLHTAAAFGRIVQLAKLSDGSVKVLVEGLSRAHLEGLRDSGEYFEAGYRPAPDNPVQNQNEVELLSKTAIDEFAKYLKSRERHADELLDTLRSLQDGGRVADTIAAHMEIRTEARIALLTEFQPERRLEQILILLETEQDKSKLERSIQKRVKQQMDKNHREYYLNEQIKAIQKELGESDEGLNDLDRLEQKIRNAKMPAGTEKKALAELTKLRQTPPMSSESTVIRNYLDWMTDFPWAKRKRTHYNLERAAAIFDRDHYGLEEVKERIIEHLAVQKRNKNNKGPIICLVGPPGVGKTSLGKSIAAATGRDFERIALGGLHDEAEIRGHRRTYIGALPGKIVQKLCKVGSSNPVILLDEIDKIGTDHRGDPASALLEVLDPAQNNAFADHYLEADIDLSKVLFIATANTLNIPAPLLDRMEVIRIPGYTTQEKLHIAERYIIPRQRKENALKDTEWVIKSGVLHDVIENYTREAGVRGLEREISKLARKTVRKLDNKKTKSITVNRKNLEGFLGTAKYRRADDDLKPKIGSVTGLAWTSVGGELLQIETAAFSGSGKLTHTGQLGDVMKESVQAALSVVRSYLDEADPDFHFSSYDIHMHLPEGATPKDGPSAGIAMATVLLSALTRQPVRGDLAMTGEITLHGRVLAIGGLKEKLLAAQRGRLKTVLIPQENQKDLRDIPDEVKDALEIVPVSHISEVFAHAFTTSSIPEKAFIPAAHPSPIAPGGTQKQ